ncbi:hypothetical protein D3C72_2336230 [compost metagenome]
MRLSARISTPARQPSGGTQPSEANNDWRAMPGMRLPALTALLPAQGDGEQNASR